MDVVFLSGPPKAGKSRLRGDLWEVLRASCRRTWHVIDANPDQEGQWVRWAAKVGRYKEAAALARKAKNALKERGCFFSPEWVERMEAQIRGWARWAELMVLDLGGLPSPENERLIRAAMERHVPHAVVLHGPDTALVARWEAFWANLGVGLLYSGPYHEALARELLGPFM